MLMPAASGDLKVEGLAATQESARERLPSFASELKFYRILP
ncbi:Uncharacterized protein ToN1_37830 [Aromatoleum petrolei]|nr:Uncharacterized protein ToN1_37830 [Aromatoleum petrolei]